MINVTKRNGRKEPLDISKIHVVVENACKELSNVFPSQIEINAQIQFYNGIKSSDIQETLIKSTADLITLEDTDYQYVAGRLISYHLRKEVYGSFEPPDLYSHLNKIIEIGYYDPLILSWYKKEEIDEINTFIDHSRDDNFTYCAMEQWRGKYLIRNRITKQFYETPQMAYILIAMCLFNKYPKETRLEYVKKYYDAISLFDISLPTPIMSSVRTTQRQFSSCFLIECDDSLDSINATTSSIVKYVAQKAGVGIGVGAIRAINSPIRDGQAYHTGITPYIKLFQAAVNSCNQGGVRKGSATVHLPIWHYEIEDFVVLKNNKGTEETRARHMDYSIQISKLFYERLIRNEDVTLFSPSEVPGLYDLFFRNSDEFEKEYKKYEADKNIRKKVVKAADLFSLIMNERKSTGRIYIMNVDHCNDHSSFITEKNPIKMSNLCLAGDTIITICDEFGIIKDIEIEKLSEEMLKNSNIKILSRNIFNEQNEFKDIINFGKTKENAKVIKITDEKTGKYIICTPEHKIYTKNRGYVEAKLLLENDELLID
jgi:ribonucleoside-diphosphate reductase alpha chain